MLLCSPINGCPPLWPGEPNNWIELPVGDAKYPPDTPAAGPNSVGELIAVTVEGDDAAETEYG